MRWIPPPFPPDFYVWPKLWSLPVPDAEALADGEYATLVHALMANGYRQGSKLCRFQLIRQVPAHDDGNPIDVIVDFLMPRDAQIVRTAPQSPLCWR